jgi:hypothetical protein
MDLPKKVANMRLKYHLVAIDINNVMNQLHLRNDNKAEKKGKDHTMVIFNDILPLLGKDVEKVFQEEES